MTINEIKNISTHTRNDFKQFQKYNIAFKILIAIKQKRGVKNDY